MAITEAARLINESRQTVIVGLGADVAGARAALALAERVGGVVDHMHSAALLRDLDVMRETGILLTTPGEARIRGDVIFLAGAGLLEAGLLDVASDLVTRTLGPPVAESPRRIFWLGAEETESSELARAVHAGNANIGLTAVDEASLSQRLAALRARVNGRRAALSGEKSRGIDALAAALRSATFGVAIWSASHLDALTIEMLCGLVKDLNANTRFTGLPLAPGDNAAGVLQVCGWMTGLPMRTGFAREFAEHDPWLFDAERLVESGEADCALWISAYGAAVPPWRKAIPLIALVPAEAELPQTPAVRISIGRPGVDHDSVDYYAAMATLASTSASRPSQTLSVAEALQMLTAAIDEDLGPPPC
jgi:formylmethanofuran dehydrogenase subunit B